MAERILLVDDEQEIADLLEVYLTSDGYEVEKILSRETCSGINGK